VKSTPTRGVKQYLKPDAYKQSEGPLCNRSAGFESARLLKLQNGSMGVLTAYLLYNGSEPTPVEKGLDDLCLGVKGQSNLEIAGSPRKLFR